MADKDLAALQVRLELQTAAFERGVKRMDKQLQKIEKNTKRSSSQMDKLGKTLKGVGKAAAAAAVGFASFELAGYAREAIEFGDAIAKTADKVGVTADELQELRFAAEQAGVSSDALDMALQRFARRMGEAAKGTGELYKTTQKLGIEFEDASGRAYSTVELLEQYAVAIGNAETQQEKLRLAFKAFDSEGAALVNLLKDGGEEMSELREQARQLGLVMGDDVTRVAESLSDQINILSTQLKVNFSESLVLATYKLADFFGVIDNNTNTRIAFLRAEIERLGEKISRLGSGEDRGGLVFMKKYGLEVSELALELNTLTAAMDETTEASKRLGEGAEPPSPPDTENWESFAKTIRDSLVTPLEKAQIQVDKVRQAFLEGYLTFDEASEAIKNIGLNAYYTLDPMGQLEKKADDLVASLNPLNEKAAKLGVLQKALERASDPATIERLLDAMFELETADFEPPKDMSEKWTSEFEEIKDAINGFTRDFTNTLVDGLMEGELAFDDFAKNVLETIAKMMLNKVFTQFFDLILNSIPGFGGGTGSSGANPQTGVQAVPDARSRMGEEVVQPRLSSSQRGGMPALNGNSPVTVNVINNGRDDVEVQERQTSRGVEIDVLIKQAVNRGISNGDFDNSMRAAYGSRRMAY